ncbi:MAG: HAD family phosphatase [archaeon]
MKFAAIFDMDGVLVDSNEYIRHSFNEILSPYNVHLSKSGFKQYLGISVRDSLKIWKKKYGVNFKVEEFSKQAGMLELSLMKENLELDHNLLKFLNRLKCNGIPMGVGTSSLRWRAEEILNMLKIQNYFSVVVTADDVSRHKPNPDLFLAVAKRLNTPPEYCVVFEDAVKGIEAAKRGNMRSVGYLDAYHSEKDLRKADLVIRDFSEISYNKLKELFC